MTKGYSHLSHEQRCQLYALQKRGLSQRAIAADLGVGQSSISRELKRNKGRRGYRLGQATAKAWQRRHKASSKSRKLTKRIKGMLERQLRTKQWSPEQISGWLKEKHGIALSHERIYQYIWADKKAGGDLHRCLRRCGKKYNRRGAVNAGRGLIPGRVDIAERPAIVTSKKRVGDWEGDTIIGKNHQGALVSIVERKTLFTLLGKQQDKTATRTTKTIRRVMHRHRKKVHTITFDNGKEFADHQTISTDLNADVYFATPYHSWERGLNENTNGLVRQYFPKNTDFTTITSRQVRKVQDLLNHRPRKTLGFKTPHEAFFSS
jgi:IS30 family transposase